MAHSRITRLGGTHYTHAARRGSNLPSLKSGGGGVLRFGLDGGGGVPLEPQNPHPFSRVILAEKSTHLWGFSPK